MAELKPCPFCGDSGSVTNYDGLFTPGCDTPDCVIFDTSFLTSAEAIEDWNRRAFEGLRTWPEMSPRERKAAVAEHVFGWRFITDHAELAKINDHDGDPDRWHMQGEWHSDRGREACVECGNLPNWPEEIGPAWEVVEKMHAEGYVTEIVVDNFGPGKPAGVDVLLWRGHGDKRVNTSAHEDTAPEAICLAALRAKGVEV